METETKARRPRNGRLSLYPLKFEDALRALAKAKPEARKGKKGQAKSHQRPK